MNRGQFCSWSMAHMAAFAMNRGPVAPLEHLGAAVSNQGMFQEQSKTSIGLDVRLPLPSLPRFSCPETMSKLIEIEQIVQRIYEKYQNFDEGDVATYIPELAKANPGHFGICLATVDGHVVCAGDWEHEFTIQSICKPFAFQLALEELGR